MKEIRTFEEAIEQNARSLKELGINGTLFWAYRTSKETGNLESQRHHRIHHQLHLLKPHRNPRSLRKTRNQHGRPYHGKGTLHRLEDRQTRPHPCNQDDDKGGINHVERRNHRNPNKGRRIQEG